jgi:hypothetical protein
MKSRALILVPVALAAAYLVARALAGGEGPRFTFIEIMLVKSFALSGCVAAVTRYQRGDRMRTIWLLFVLDFALLIGKDAVTSPVLALGPRLLGPAVATALRILFMVGANLAGTIAWIILARTFRVAGITLALSPTSQRVVVLATIVLSIVIVAWGTLNDVRQLASAGGSETFLHVVSDVADVIGFSLVAPVALAAWSLRGGTLFWPYVYLAACTFTWMLFDMTDALAVTLHLGVEQRHFYGELCRCIACGLHFAAGLAARWAVGLGAVAVSDARAA